MVFFLLSDDVAGLGRASGRNSCLSSSPQCLFPLQRSPLCLFYLVPGLLPWGHRTKTNIYLRLTWLQRWLNAFLKRWSGNFQKPWVKTLGSTCSRETMMCY